ncbi:MAG: T9SS type A sorting domain-containing protein, partial [Chitinophagaceae bacterium]|nr:T9SS type A sorting domain-containing protein [Chitinophagaceae bacterium]
DPVADTTGNILRLRNVVHPDTGSVFDGFLYWYRYTVSNGTCTYSGVFVLQLNSPVPERGYESVLNLPCNTTTANIAVLKPGPLLYSTYRNLKVLSKPAGAPDPTLPPPFSSSIVVSGLQPGKYIFSFEYYRRSPDCGVKTHTVEVNVSQTPGLSNAGTDQVLPCGVDSSVLAGNTPPPGQQGTWRLVSGPSTVILTNPNAPSLLIKSLAPGLYRFRWEIAYGINCPANADEMQVIVTPNAPVTSAGPDQTVCYGYAIPLSGTGFGAGTTARWRQIGGSPLAIADSTASATTVSGTIASSVYTFSYTLSNVCGSSSDTVVVSTTASPGPSEARISTADTCIATSSLMLNAVAPASGSGIWRQLSGSAIATIAAPASNNTSVSGLTGGVYQFIWTVRQAGCDSLSDTVSVAYATGTIMANAGDDRFVCQDTLRLGAVPSSSGLGTWSQLSGSVATIADPADPATLVAGLQAGAYTFRWVVSLGVCQADTDEMNVVVSAAPSTAKAMNDTVICGLAMPSGTQITVPIRADTPSSGIGTWTILETPYGFGSTSGISDPAASNTTIKLVGGYYKLLWKVANGACPESVDTLSIDVVPMADAGSAPVRICEKKTYKLQGSLPGSGTVRWSQLDGPAVLSFTNPESEFTTVTNFDTGTYLIRYEVLHPGVGCSSADTITIINDKSVSANAGRDTVFCWKPGGTTLYLQADTPSAGTGTWFRNNGMGSVSYSPGTNSNPTNATVSDAGLHQFRWTVRNGACQTIDYKNVIAERVTVPPIDFTPLTVCKDSFTVQVSSPYTDFEYAWSFQRARITDTSGLNLSGPITNNFRISDTNKIYLTLTNPASGCSATDSTEIIVNCSYLPLPLTLLSFNAYKRGATVLVKWETAAEKNIRSYTVERSADGRLWQKLEELGVTGNSSLKQEYRITDARPLAGINLYRLKIEEYDRSISYSSSRQVNMDGAQTGILVFPNPADQAITVVWDNGDTVNYLLTDALGRKVLAGRLNINTSGRINLSALPQGSYVLKITSGAATISVHKVQIVR